MRETTDAVRSVKKYLADVLGVPPAPLAAARRLRPPSDDILADARDARAYGVWTGLDETDTPAEAVIATKADSTDLLRVPVLIAKTRWFITPPLARRNAGSGDVEAAETTEDTYSPGLVKGCVAVTQGPTLDDQWETCLAMPRYVFDLSFLDGLSHPYRVRPFDGDPALSASDFVVKDAVPEAATWDIRFFHDRGALTGYPVAVVKAVGPTNAVSPHSNYSEMTQTMTVYLYPTPPAGEDFEFGEAQVAAERTRSLLLSAFDVRAAKPMRIPLYDYDGIAYNQVASQRESYDYLKVVDVSVEVLPEPGDPTLTVVVADLRVAWTIQSEKGRGTNIVSELDIDLTVS